MTLLAVEGFDAQDILQKNWVAKFSHNAPTPTYSSTTPYSSGSSYQTSASTLGTTLLEQTFGHVRAVTPSARLICGVMVYPVTVQLANTTEKFLSLWGDTQTTEHLALRTTDLAGNFGLYRGGTLLASSSTPMVIGAWNFIEIDATIDDVTGSVTVRLNNVSVLTFTGDTRNAGTSTNLDGLYIGGGSNNNGAQVNTFLFDDVYICNALGSRNNSLLGITRVQTLMPTGAGSSTQFTPVSGANYTNVNDVPDNTATYNSDTVSGHRDTFAMADLASGTDTIYGVQQTMHAAQLDAGISTIKQAQKSGATVSYGSTFTLGLTNGGFLDVFEINPATSAAYTQSDINALEAGYEVV